MNRPAVALAVTLVAAMLAASVSVAQTNPPSEAAPAAPQARAAGDYSGMYSFLKEGEFVQLTVEDTRVTGFVSRYGEAESDQGAFLNQFFKAAALEGKKLTFTTQIVHGVQYDFKGAIERGEGKNPGDEGYYVLKGKLTQSTSGSDKKVASKTRDVVLKAFPQNLGDEPAATQ